MNLDFKNIQAIPTCQNPRFLKKLGLLNSDFERKSKKLGSAWTLILYRNDRS